MRSILCIFVALTLLANICGDEQKIATLVLRHGKVVTLDANLPEAEAVAVYNDKIMAVGTDAQIAAYIGDKTQVIDLEGQLTIPGFIEGHGHFMSLGNSKMILDLRKAKSWDEIVAIVKKATTNARPGEWIVGRGWHQEKWQQVPQQNIAGIPLHNSLSAISPQNPVLLVHASGHATYANAKAMQLARINSSTKAPPGGEILRDDKSNPTGYFRETAADPLYRAMETSQRHLTAEQRRELALRQIELATHECLEKGITTFHDAGSPLYTINLFRQLARENQLDIRLWVMIRDSNTRLKTQLPQHRIIGLGGNHLTVRAIKLSIDGALGSHGAWLLKPYTDLPESTGLNTTPLDYIEETARLAITHGFQLCIHAIGDRANREVLDVYEKSFAANPDKKDLRWRVEHAQHLNPADIPRFAKLGVIASMQSVHCTSDAPWVITRLGEKRAHEGAYVWRTLIENNAIIINGTDAPVEDVSPIACFYSAVTRMRDDGKAFFPEQRMTRLEALRSYTSTTAYAGFEEDIKGTLTPGKLADITVLSQDILSIPEQKIPETQVVYTIVGGQVKYSLR